MLSSTKGRFICLRERACVCAQGLTSPGYDYKSETSAVLHIYVCAFSQVGAACSMTITVNKVPKRGLCLLFQENPSSCPSRPFRCTAAKADVAKWRLSLCVPAEGQVVPFSFAAGILKCNGMRTVI